MDAIALGLNDGPAWDGSLATVNNYGAAYALNGAKEQYVFGVVYAKTNSRVIAIGKDDKGTADPTDDVLGAATHAIAADANFVLVDLTKAKNNVTVSSYAEFREFKLDAGTGSVIVDNDYAVFMKYYNDEITDVVIYKGYLTGGYDAL